MPTKSKSIMVKSKSKSKKDEDDDAESNNNTELTIDDQFRLADLYFNQKNYMFRHLYDSYNKFIEEDVKNFLELGDHIFTESMTTTTYYKYRFKYENVRVEEPVLSNGVEPMFPAYARRNRQTYSIKIIADVTQYQEIIDIASEKKTTNRIGTTAKDYHVATIPLMVRSKWCALITHKDSQSSECEYDPGGYFIVNGNEKVVISQDRMVENKPLVFIKKDSGTISHVVQVNSRSYDKNGIIQVLMIRLRKNKILTLRVPILNEINVCVMFRALGFVSDKQIIGLITHDDCDNDMIDLVRLTLDACKNEKGNRILTEENAIDYLIPKMRIIKKYSQTDQDVALVQKRMHLKNLLEYNFLPHVEGGIRKKAYYLGYMINRLLRVYLKRLKLDDRDSYVNKRIDLPGDLMFELYKQQDKKMLGDCKKYFDTRNKDHDTPVYVIQNIKPNTIEQGFKASLSTGYWIRKQGVAQMLQRLTYIQTISFLRRVDAPGGDNSSMKLTNPRHLHPSSVGFLDPGQTPEHAKVGLTKHLSIIASITIMSRDQYSLVKDYLYKNTTSVLTIPISDLRNWNIYKVLLNGDWIGITEKYVELEQEMVSLKLSGFFDQKNVSIVADHEEGEIRIYCDSGRLYRPILRVEDNQVLLTKKQIDSISLNRTDKATKVTGLDEFTLKYKDAVEYICMELQPYIMIAHKIKLVEKARNAMIKSLEMKPKPVTNRYDEMSYVKYTHCEIHPSLLLGEILTNVSFLEYMHGPRVMFSYAQGRQAMGIYTTNYRDRLDISFVLYHPQRPIVSTRTAKYTNAEILPAGENAIVAIACYTGLRFGSCRV